MSNGDTAAEILEYIENEGADLPKTVTNKMLAVVLREQHQNTRAVLAQIEKSIGKVADGVKLNASHISELERCQAVFEARLQERGLMEKEAAEKTDKQFDHKVRSWEAYGGKEFIAGLLGGISVFVISSIPKLLEWIAGLF